MDAAERLFDGSVPVLGIGTAALTVPYGAPGAERSAPSAIDARRVLLAAVDWGVRFVDTAPAYGASETFVGQALGDRLGCAIATKLAIPPAGWSAMSPTETRAHVRASAEASLRALRRERLDLLQVHNADAALLNRGAVLDALVRLRDEGLASSIGATVYGEAAALAVIATPALDVVQIAFSALDRRAERRVLPAAAAAGTAVVARSLLLRGVLSPAGRELRGPFAPLSRAADAIRHALGVSWEELPGAAVAFVASRPGIACALLGPRDETELTALLDQVERFAAAVGEVTTPAPDLDLPVPDLPDELLDPSRWPVETTVGS
jgi:aryl-alcohol dehydrogenase-like predicted oxidoreductase